MGQLEKLITLILGGRSDQNIGFADICTLLQRLGFSERIRGSHHIFFRVDIPEIINLQPKGKKAKAYQVKQVRNLILNYHLEIGNE